MVSSLLSVGFRGKLIQRNDEGYNPSIYQYAWSSYKEEKIVDPDAVIYPTDDDDVKLAIQYATQANVGIAIRTGGHHYTGASSSGGSNIQLDLSQTYTDLTWENTDRTQVTVGISTTLSKFMGKLRKQKRFLPVGQCSYVNLGGHVQTGGYGHLIRSFGLLADYVEAIRIITADAEVRCVERGVDSDKDLFYAVLGGSPGNFGVITHVTLRVLRDEDFPKSRGLYGKTLYTREKLKQLLDIMVEMGESDETPADYDFSVSVVSERDPEGKLAAGIVVFVQWANLEGEGQEYDHTLFDKVNHVIEGLAKESGGWKPHHGSRFDGGAAPMSTLCSLWVFPIAREFQLPYYKRTYITESKTLKQDGWAKWASDRLDEVTKDTRDGCYASSQFQHVGGKYSRFCTNDPNHDMSFSWRDSTYACTMDVFYDVDYPTPVDPKTKAREWVERNDAEGVGHEGGYYSKQDRRLLWGSKDLDLEAARDYYYDSKEKYGRLSEIKKTADPQLVFTANKFAVGPHPDRLN